MLVELIPGPGTVVRLACDLINEWLLDARRRVSAEEGMSDRRVRRVRSVRSLVALRHTKHHKTIFNILSLLLGNV